MLYGSQLTLLNVPSVTQNQTGTAYKLRSSEVDGVNNYEQRWSVVMFAQQTGGSSSPTTDIVFETSADGTNWITVSSLTQLTADGSSNTLFTDKAILTYVRAKLTLGGGVKPTVNAKVYLVSNGQFVSSAAS